MCPKLSKSKKGAAPAEPTDEVEAAAAVDLSGPFVGHKVKVICESMAANFGRVATVVGQVDWALTNPFWPYQNS